MNGATSRQRAFWPAAALALLGVLVSSAVVVEARARGDRAEERAAAEAAARAVLPVTRAVAAQLAAAEGAAGRETREVGPTDPDGPSAGVAAQARDTGAPVLDDAGAGVIVVARYAQPAPASVAARRAALTGFALTPLRIAPTLAASTEASGDSLTLSGPDRAVAGYGNPSGARFTVSLDDSLARGWTLTATGAGRPVSVGAWLAALALLLLGLAGGAVSARRAVRSRRSEHESWRRARHDAGLAELALVGQASLDLAEVLPASFALLEETLDLAGLALAGTASGTSFVWRDAPPDDEPARPASAPVPAGACLDVPLARGGRSLGSLRVRPLRDLDELDLRTLATAAETISSSLANADAFDHQRALVARMRKLDDLKTVFVATASHELRTPVAAVIGYVTMLTENWGDLDPDTGLLYAQRVERNARRLGALVEDLLDFSRLEQGRAVSGEPEPLDLGAEVRTFLEADPGLTPHHDLRVSATPGLVVAGSRLAVERVVGNLVGNAAKYSPAGTTISVRVERTGDGARLVVDDEGPGVPPEEREQIFSRFFRGAGDAVTRTQGAGLGLAIVTEFARSMGGSVAIASAPGGGTRFEVTYPLHVPAPALAATPEPEPEPESEPGEAHVHA